MKIFQSAFKNHIPICDQSISTYQTPQVFSGQTNISKPKKSQINNYDTTMLLQKFKTDPNVQ